MHARFRYGISVALGTVVILALVAIWILARDVSRRLEDAATAATDNVQWVIAQVEVEYLVFHAAVLRAEVDGTPALPEVRTRFDVFYSRIVTIESSSAFAELRQQSSFASALDAVRGFLDATAPQIDGSDTVLLAYLYDIEAQSDLLRPEVRTLGLTGISHFAQAGDARRVGIEATLARVALLATGLVVILLAALGLLLWLLSRVRRSSSAAEMSRARMSAVVASSLDAVIVADKAGRVLDFNKAGESTFGYARDEIVGKTMADTVVPPHLRAAHDAGMQRYLKTREPHVIGKGRVQLEAVRKDGSLFPVELSISSASAGGTEVFVSFLRDITDRLAAEDELREARDQALAGERAKARFIAVMSHEMRTPLNGILGAINLMDRDQLSERDRKYADVVRQSGELLLHHVNDVLDISKVDAGQAEISEDWVSLPALVEEVVESLSPLAETGGNKIHVDLAKTCHDPVVSDARRLQQVLVNLVGNALKFTRQGEVTISLARLGKTDEVELQVIDTGIGMPAEALQRIFDDFVTLDNSYDRESGGTGLGLAITRRMVELLDGEIGVESEEGEGSLFWVRLPLPRASADAKAQPQPSAETAGAADPADIPTEILVVEDNEINRMIIEEMLIRAHRHVTLAHDGVEAVEMAAGQHFDTILMDISMPRMDGVLATREIRAGDGPNAETRIIALTAHALPDEMARFKEAGMNDVLTKPVDSETLIRVLDDAPVARRESSDNLKPVAYEILKRLADDVGQDRYEGLVSAFIRQADAGVADLAAAHPDAVSDAKLMADVHRLAGAAAVFGARRLHSALSRLEERGKAGKMEEVWPGLKDLETLWSECRPIYVSDTHREQSQYSP